MKSPFNQLVLDSCSDTRKHLHYLNILNTGDEALLVRIHLIRSALKTIDIQTFIWKNDAVGQLFVKELARAAERGVKVNLLIDPWASDKSPHWVACMQRVHPNLRVKFYNPNANEINPSFFEVTHAVMTDFRKFNQRMHNKLFIVDNQVGITGGRNYENSYYDRAKGKNFKDRDVLVIGPIVTQMTNSFKDYWHYKLSISGEGLKDVREFIKNNENISCALLKKPEYETDFETIKMRVNDQDYIKTHFVDKALSVTRIRFIVDKPEKNKSSSLVGGGVVYDEFLKFNEKAEKEIIAQTPYLVLDKRLVTNIKNIQKAHPQLDILISTNSLASTDNIYTYSYARKERKKYVKDLFFRIFELKPVPADWKKMMGFIDKGSSRLCVHAKSFVIDSSSVWIGSFNIDPRSFNLNTEAAIVIDDEKFAKIVKDNILLDMQSQNSWTVGKKFRVPIKSFFGSLLFYVTRYLPIKEVWPFSYTDNFELKEGQDAIPFYDKRFYARYKSVGPYPGMKDSLKEIEVMLLKALIEIVKPIL